MNTPVTTAEDRAAAWAARLEVAPLGRAEAAELQTWLDEDPAHALLLEEFTLIHLAVKAELPVMAKAGELPREVASPGRSRNPFANFRAGWRAWTGGLAAAAALILTAAWFVRLPSEIVTAAGQRQEVVLADGSHVSLNARTSLAVMLHGDQRRVRLDEGEAYFAVAKDPARPFLVETPAGTVRVTGTHFNVRADSAETLEVTVLEGSVGVRAGGTDRALTANDQLTYNGLTPDVRRLAASAALDVIAWRDGRVVGDGVPLRVVLDRYARYHGVAIEVAPGVETLPLGGIFKLDDLDGFLRDIRETLPIHVLRDRDNRRIRILPR